MGGLLAHGVGSRGDLPLPLWQFAWAATFALVASFIALGALWTRPLLADAAGGRSLIVGGPMAKVAESVVRALSFALFVTVLVSALIGDDSADTNLAPVTIYVVMWVGVALVSGLVADVWRWLNPFETIALVMPARVEPAPITHWPATAMLFGFLILELVHPSGDSPRVLGIAMVVYSLVMVSGMWRWGRSWLDAADGFGVLFGLLGAMAPLWGDEKGTLRARAPLSGLARIEPRPGTAVLILVVLGATTFDGLAESELWRDLVGRQSGWSGAVVDLVGLVVVIQLMAILYALGALAIGRATGLEWRDAAAEFAPSLVPILFGYTIAHYAQLLLDETQTFTFRLSDPAGRGWDLFGTVDNSINFDVISVDVIAWIQAIGIVIGHVAGVMVAHDRAIERFDKADAIRSQYAMLLVMVVYSIGGLWLLLNG